MAQELLCKPHAQPESVWPNLRLFGNGKKTDLMVWALIQDGIRILEPPKYSEIEMPLVP